MAPGPFNLHLSLGNLHIPIGKVRPEEFINLPSGLTVLESLKKPLDIADERAVAAAVDDLVARHYRGGHIGFEPMAHGGASQSGRYTIRIQAAGVDLKHHYDWLDDYHNGDPIVMELAAVNREGSVESTGNITTQRTLAS